MDGCSQETENSSNKKNSYDQWTEQETDELLKLLVDATLEHRKDKSGAFSKKTVETRILPKLNRICQCNKTYENFKEKYRWFKNRLGQYQEMFKCSSGFVWNPDTKMIDGTDEMWDNYLE
ncbi:hypothetical protein MKW94_003238, partial [Papaver nudicaule]|nr:hypothetical protein [Papaver nudicaule]